MQLVADKYSSDTENMSGSGKMWNHLCLISLAYFAGKWIDAFEIECSVVTPAGLSTSGDFSRHTHST
jgi:hypothetical protein